MPVELPTDRKVHTTFIRVRFYELDPYDHVNHTNYLAYFETARIEFLTENGFGLHVMKERDIQLVVAEINVRFHAAARYGEELTINTWIGEVGRARSTWHQIMTRDGELVAQLELTAAFTDATGRPRRIPEGFALFAKSLQEGV